MESETAAKPKVSRRGGQRPWLVVAAVLLLAGTAVALFLFVDKPEQATRSQEDIQEQAKVVQATITQYEQKSSLHAQGSAEYVNARGVAAVYAAENGQCSKARELMNVDTDDNPETLDLKKQFDDEIGRLCKA